MTALLPRNVLHLRAKTAAGDQLLRVLVCVNSLDLAALRRQPVALICDDVLQLIRKHAAELLPASFTDTSTLGVEAEGDIVYASLLPRVLSTPYAVVSMDLKATSSPFKSEKMAEIEVVATIEDRERRRARLRDSSSSGSNASSAAAPASVAASAAVEEPAAQEPYDGSSLVLPKPKPRAPKAAPSSASRKRGQGSSAASGPSIAEQLKKQQQHQQQSVQGAEAPAIAIDDNGEEDGVAPVRTSAAAVADGGAFMVEDDEDD
jgi:hypothetical protein